jgi:nucleoside-diphosphate-sugar epimerase
MKRILLSGGSGYVGQQWLSQFQQLGLAEQVIRVGRTPKDDLSWSKLCMDDLRHVSAVFHLAGTTDVGVGCESLEVHRTVNVDYTKTLFELFLNSSSQLFVFMSTAKVMGEGRSEPYCMSDTCCPSTDYAQSKWEGEEVIQSLWANWKSLNPNSFKRWLILRPVVIHGEGLKRSIYQMHRWARLGLPFPVSIANTKRSMVHITTVLKALTLEFDSVRANEIRLEHEAERILFLADRPAETLNAYLMGSMPLSPRLRTVNTDQRFCKLLISACDIVFRGRIKRVQQRLSVDFVVSEEGVYPFHNADPSLANPLDLERSTN